VPIGSMLALMAGGWINDVASWRQAFIWLGLPGLVLGVITLLTVREPARISRPSEATAWSSAWALLRKPTFRHMAMGIGAYAIGANAMIVFTPAFLMRSHGLSATKAGLWLGLIYGIAGVIGTLGGGWVGDRFGRRDGRWRLWVPALALAVAAPCTLAAWLVPGAGPSLWLLAIPKFSNLVYIAPVFAALQTLAPAHARASASALLLFFNSLIGLALGPPLVGLLSDWLSAAHGDQSLRYALCLVPLAQVWAAVHFTLAARSLKADRDPSLTLEDA
jgi:predicted MFS family arabinose efflux permease